MVFVPLIAVLISLAAFVGCILALPMSVEKWQTFKRMLGALVVVAVLIVCIGGLAAWWFHSTVGAVLTGAFCVPASLLAALITGIRHDSAVKKALGAGAPS